MAGKADVGDHVVDRGPLGFGPDAAPQAEFTEDLEFHGYTLQVRAGARVSVECTQRGSQRSVDPTLFVYGPRQAEGGFGTTALAFDDDSGWGRLPRLRDLTLSAAGAYLVVVGTHDARGRGRYRLEARCESGECGPTAPPPPSAACHPAIAGAISACIADWLADADWLESGMSRRDLVHQCADAEPVAPAFDELCASDHAPADLCAMSLEELTLGYLLVCRREQWHAMLDGSCVFGQIYRDLFRPGAIVTIARRPLDPASALNATQAAQIVATMRAAGFDTVTSAGAAFAAADGNTINQTELWDASNRRAYTAYELGAGDTSIGTIFVHGTVTPAARINDGDLVDCTATWGEEMRECESDADCRGDIRCRGVGAEISLGRCIEPRNDGHPSEGADCVLESGCPPGSGLICGGAPTSGAGICVPAWMKGRFESRAEMPIPDGSAAGLDASLAVYGLATVDMDVVIDLYITHPRVADLTISLVNPATADVLVFDGSVSGETAAGELSLREHVVRGFSGDEQVNGIWHLVVVDRRSGSAGTLHRFGLQISSRWD